MRRNILFVTSQDGSVNDGLRYVIDLARVTQKGIAVLMLYKENISEWIEDWMTAVTFAEANEHETARGVLNGSAHYGTPGKKLLDIQEKCMESGISTNIYTATEDIPSALKGLLKRDRSIDLVLLSPNITGNGKLTARDLRKLLRTVSMPIVTLTRNARSHPNKSMEVA